MADIKLTAKPVLGVDLQIGANRITDRSDLALVSVATPLGGDAALAKALQGGWGLESPTHTHASTAGDLRAIQTTADQMLLVFPHPTPDANAVVQAKLAGTGYTTDQTDNWVMLEISGPDTGAALERLCPLDAATMPVGASARTVMEHLGVLMVKLEADRYWLLSASSSAGSFLHAVQTSYDNVS